MESPVKCCDCGCDCSPDPWIRSVKRKHSEVENTEKRFTIPELDELELFSYPKVHIENECSLLRETVTNQQQSIQELYDELDKERNAASTAADASMFTIQRLQSEKAEVQMELRQYQLYVGEKMEHDNQEILALEDLVYQREQTILALTCEAQAYKHRMLSYGLTDGEADGHKTSEYDNDLTTYDYPPLKCNVNENQDPLEAEDIFDYPPADSPHGKEHLKTLDLRISQMETQSPRRIFTTGSSSSKQLRPDVSVDTPRSQSCISKNVSYTEYNNGIDDFSEVGDEMSDRVYTIDSVHHSVSHSSVTDQKVDDVGFMRGRMMDHGDPDITKLYMRLHALEADRESMKQALLSMRTEKAQMVLLKEIAQHLSKEVVPQRRLPLRKANIPGTLTVAPVFKWITSFVSWKRKARRSKYMFEMAENNNGLRMVLEKVPRSRKWRCLRSTQV